MVVLYHYTNEEGAAAIKKSKKIRKSVGAGADAAFGDGTYFTSLSPRNAASMIYHNNWGLPRSLVDAVDRLRVEYFIKVSFPDDDPNLEQCKTRTNRDIWLYAGSDVNLKHFKHEIEEFSDFDSESMVKKHGNYSLLVCSYQTN